MKRRFGQHLKKYYLSNNPFWVVRRGALFLKLGAAKTESAAVFADCPLNLVGEPVAVLRLDLDADGNLRTVLSREVLDHLVHDRAELTLGAYRVERRSTIEAGVLDGCWLLAG